MSTIEVRVPDIGDFKDVPVIEVFVKPGDAVKAEDSLVTLESDKATMDVPSPAAGTVKDVRVKLGDKVGEGTLIVILDAAAAATTRPRLNGRSPIRSSRRPNSRSCPSDCPLPRRRSIRRMCHSTSNTVTVAGRQGPAWIT